MPPKFNLAARVRTLSNIALGLHIPLMHPDLGACPAPFLTISLSTLGWGTWCFIAGLWKHFIFQKLLLLLPFCSGPGSGLVPLHLSCFIVALGQYPRSPGSYPCPHQGLNPALWWHSELCFFLRLPCCLPPLALSSSVVTGPGLSCGRVCAEFSPRTCLSTDDTCSPQLILPTPKHYSFS